MGIPAQARDRLLDALAAAQPPALGARAELMEGLRRDLGARAGPFARAGLPLELDEQLVRDVWSVEFARAADRLAKRGLLLPGTRRSVLSNTLVVVVPADSQLRIRKPADLASPRIRALALAEPQTVPAGIYAKQWLSKLGLWRKVAARVVPTENVRGALAAVESGNAEAGIVYRTDARISKQVRIAYQVPRKTGPRISYPFAVLANSERKAAARRFLAYLESPGGLAVFRRYGFIVL